MELKDIKGLGKARIEALNEHGIFNPLDLLKTEPTKYLDYSEIAEINKKTDVIQTVKAEIISVPKCAFFRGKSSVIVKAQDINSLSSFTCVWYNQPYLKSTLKMKQTYFLTGKFNKAHQFVVQTIKLSERITDNIVPVYRKTSGITSQIIISSIKQILEFGVNYSVLSDEDEEKNNLMKLMNAYCELHFPTDILSLEKAKERINFEDLLLLASLEKNLKYHKKTKDRKYKIECIKDFVSTCPFSLTSDQQKVLAEINSDLESDEVMNRLVLGDVGSGKTMVAFGAGYVAVKSGYQVVFLCPTEILASQHYESANKFLLPLGVNIKILNSKLNNSEKKEVLKSLENGEIEFLIATHSALSKNVIFKNLGLVITDEQHRFGVGQRASIEKKGNNPDVLVMSATPIPRSLSLVLFGGLSVSEINSRPNGESRIETKLVPSAKEKSMWGFILNNITENSGKCFVIAPRIDESENSNILSVGEIKKKLLNYGVSEDLIACVHGKTEKNEASKIIEEFKNGNKKILISTTIVEVGIDVPTANLMVIYNADRFGLATLHQLRGRVGRDGREGFCFCLSDTESLTAIERLEIFKKYNSGIRLAEEDLKVRGAGTIYGTKQHGASEIFLNLNFSMEKYLKAKDIINSLDAEKIDAISSQAEKMFGKIYENIVLN